MRTRRATDPFRFVLAGLAVVGSTGVSVHASGSARFETPSGAGRTSPPVEPDLVLHPNSSKDLRATLQQQYGAPGWFPLPESIERKQSDPEQNTIQTLSVSQDLPGPRPDTPLRSELVLTYLLPKLSPQQAIDWVKTRPGYPKFKVVDGQVTGNSQTPYLFESRNQTMLVYSRKPNDNAPKGTRLSVTVSSVEKKFKNQAGFVALQDWPKGIAWEGVETFMAQQYGSADGTEFYGSHSVRLEIDAQPRNSTRLKQILSNPASYTGSIRLAGKPSTKTKSSGDRTWTVPITWLGRPGTCVVNDFVDPNRSPARCQVRFGFK
jgi:hypothetical protein